MSCVNHTFCSVKKFVCASLIFFFIVIPSSVQSQKSVNDYIQRVNSDLTQLTKKITSGNYPQSFESIVNNISDLFYKFSSSISNVSAAEDDQQLLIDFTNYSDILKGYISNPSEDAELLKFIQEDLKVKTSSNLGLGSQNAYRKAALHIKVFNTDQTTELAGYSVFVKPYNSLNPDLELQLNPTNNAIGLITPGIKKVLIYQNDTLVDERKVLLYYKDDNTEQVEIFVR